MFGVVNSHKLGCLTNIKFSFYPDFTENHNFFHAIDFFFVEKINTKWVITEKDILETENG